MPIHRHPALAPLSRDHHVALQLAAAVRIGGSRHLRSRLPPEPRALAAHVRKVFDEELGPHFALEERYLMVAIDGLDPEIDTLCADLRREHDAIRSVVRELGSARRASAIEALLDRFGRLLEAHVRAEERGLFTRAQEILDPHALAEIARHVQRRVHPAAAGSGAAVPPTPATRESTRPLQGAT